MKKFIIRLLIRWAKFDGSVKLNTVDQEALRKWLYISYRDYGWKQYYTLRKKVLLNLLGLGIENNQEYWQAVGRLKELKVLGSNINIEIKRRKKIEVKKG